MAGLLPARADAPRREDDRRDEERMPHAAKSSPAALRRATLADCLLLRRRRKRVALSRRRVRQTEELELGQGREHDADRQSELEGQRLGRARLLRERSAHAVAILAVPGRVHARHIALEPWQPLELLEHV